LIAKAVEYGGMTGKGIFRGIQRDVIDTGLDELFPSTKVYDFLFGGITTGSAGWMMTYGSTKDRLPPSFRPDNGFAFFNGQHNTSDNQHFQVSASAEMVKTFTDIISWENRTDLSSAETCTWTGKYCQQWWPNADAEGETEEESECNQLRGTDGHQFPAELVKLKENLWIFNTDFCGSFPLRYNQNVNIRGIESYRYTLPDEWFHVNKTSRVCACQELSNLIADNNSCVKQTIDDPTTLDIADCGIARCYDGLLDLTICQGTPTMISKPHFLGAPGQSSNFLGLQPEEEVHETVYDIDPFTGMSVSYHRRYQVNTPVFNNADTGLSSGSFATNLTFLENINSVPAFPVFWLEETTTLEEDPDMMRKLKAAQRILLYLLLEDL